MNKYLPLILAGLVGCTTVQERQIYNTEPLRIIIDDFEGINESYQNYMDYTGDRNDDLVTGFRVGNTIYSMRDDNETLGHELRHILEGEWHE